jgi:ATP-dependent protease ClpP protease subunit
MRHPTTPSNATEPWTGRHVLPSIVEEILARHTGRSREQIRTDSERDTILTGRQALEYGFADELARPRELLQAA